MIRKLHLFVGLLLYISFVHAQELTDHKVVVAEQGDGIFSLLRKNGLDPGKYYGEFLDLNQKNIKNGSFLHLGREYFLPNAPDSYSKTAVRVQLEDSTEQSIFTSELASISAKSDKLNDAVIYLISAHHPKNTSESVLKITKDINLAIAKDLMVHGAIVYLIEAEGGISYKYDEVYSLEKQLEPTELPMAPMDEMGGYVDKINKRFLKHYGKYQRLLITRVNGVVDDKNYDVSIFHHGKDDNSKQIAGNLRDIFARNNVKSKSIKKYNDVFVDRNNLYLAKNALPPITLVDIENEDSESNEISVKADKNLLSNMITDGVLKDYAQIQITN